MQMKVLLQKGFLSFLQSIPCTQPLSVTIPDDAMAHGPELRSAPGAQSRLSMTSNRVLNNSPSQMSRKCTCASAPATPALRRQLIQQELRDLTDQEPVVIMRHLPRYQQQRSRDTIEQHFKLRRRRHRSLPDKRILSDNSELRTSATPQVRAAV